MPKPPRSWSRPSVLPGPASANPPTLQETVLEASSKSPLLLRSQRIRALLERREGSLGILPHADEIFARQLAAIEGVLKRRVQDDVVVHRDVVIAMVREHGSWLAKGRRKPKRAREDGEQSLTAPRLADEMIHHDGPEALYPWLPKMIGAREELIAAIEATI